MKVKTAKAAVLAESRRPLVVDEIIFPDELDVEQVLVKILYTTICGTQINEIEAVKGPDRFLPHLLGHEASGSVIETGPGVTNVKPGDAVVVHWRPSRGIQSSTPSYKWRGQKLTGSHGGDPCRTTIFRALFGLAKRDAHPSTASSHTNSHWRKSTLQSKSCAREPPVECY
jgi:hypothetical protein